MAEEHTLLLPRTCIQFLAPMSDGSQLTVTAEQSTDTSCRLNFVCNNTYNIYSLVLNTKGCQSLSYKTFNTMKNLHYFLFSIFSFLFLIMCMWRSVCKHVHITTGAH